MKLSKKSLYKKFKKYQTGGPVTPDLPKSGPELTFPADVYYGEENLTGQFPTGDPLGTYVPPQFPGLQSKQLEATAIPELNFNTLSGPNMKDVTVTPSEQGQQDKDKKNNQGLDANSLFTLGLAGISTGLNYNANLQNTRRLNESIQQRQSDPVYDYNYMYGRTTTGGTQYQPIIKAEMGAKIQKRYNTPNSLNDVEIEGGEFIQLPDMSTEMAEGPSHSNGGISTNLPGGTRVYSDTLKPEGSKKTFAQLAKKYDNTTYDKVLDNKFSKQVDKDTAMLMKQKNQKMLDKLFMDQQILNGNSNGEVMAKNGASIDNPGFRALPPAVQQKIISNMEYGGFSLPNPFYMQNGGNWYSEGDWDAAQAQAAMSNLPNVNQNRIVNPGFNMSAPDPTGLGYAMNRTVINQTPSPQQVASGQMTRGFDTLPWNQGVYTGDTEGVYNPFANSAPSPSTVVPPTNVPTPSPANNQTAQTAPTNQTAKTTASAPKQAATEKEGFQLYTTSTTPEGGKTPTGESSYARSKTVEEYMKPWKGIIPDVEKMSESDFQSAVYDYELKNNPTAVADMWKQFGLTSLGKKDQELLGLTKDGVFDEEKLKDPEVLAKLKKAYVDGFAGARTLMPSKAGDTDVKANEPDLDKEVIPEKKDAKTPDFDAASETQQGQYTKQGFPIMQAIPNLMGLAGAQEVFPYAIPEVDAPYLRPQELQIQAQLQNIDNMGQAAVRSGADPLAAYIQGTTAKQQVYQAKQNYDAQQRGQTDVRNAMMQQQANAINAQMFDRTYNNLIAQARDAQSAEKQAAVANLIKKKAMHDQSENIKEAYINNLTNAFNVGADGASSFDVVRSTQPLVNSGYINQNDANVITNEVNRNLAERAKAAKGKTSSKKTSKKK